MIFLDTAPSKQAMHYNIPRITTSYSTHNNQQISYNNNQIVSYPPHASLYSAPLAFQAEEISNTESTHMSDREVLITTLKNMLIKQENTTTTPEELLDHKAKLIGFSDFREFLIEINIKPKELINKSVEIHKRICQAQIPSPDTKYCMFKAYPDHTFSYKTTWIGKDENGRDMLIPATVSTDIFLGELPENITRPYVINDLRELLLWSYRWFGMALVKEAAAREYFHEFFQKRKP
ncbi:hypothetical protein [Ectopseudomonas mendocina]|uniref:hypothetical protein n=1 Tax=Ectopseudomonas mendocina TaxID=300 RepID=UPI0011C0177B|nr:hypothetical protein [Pseudomonas mendocina]